MRAILFRVAPSVTQHQYNQGLTQFNLQYHRIVPIINPLVCGLHCESNLQILRADENMKKSNRHWPDMPTITWP